MPEADDSKPMCTVLMDDKVHVSDDFVAILSDETGKASIFYYTDAMTLGMAVKMIAHEYIRAITDLPEEDRNKVIEFLGAEFAPEHMMPEQEG